MLNFGAYKGRDIQALISLANQFEAEGVTDIVFIRQRLEEYIASKRRIDKPKYVSTRKHTKKPTCPECGDKWGWYESIELKEMGITIDLCKKCAYSRMVK